MGKRFLWALCFVVAISACVWGDWPSTGGSPQREGWFRGESNVTKDTIANKQVKLIYTYKFDNESKGLTALSTPIELNSIIGYKGFKELLFVGGSNDVVYAFDDVVGAPFFKTQFDSMAKPASAGSSAVCVNAMTANLAMSGSAAAAGRGGFAPPPAPARGAAAAPGAAPAAGAGAPLTPPGGAPAAGPAPAAAAAARGRGAGGGGGGRGPAVFFAVSSDGYLRTLRQQDGDAKWIAPTQFVPAGSHVSGLNVDNNVIYASTNYACGGNPNGLYAALYTPPQLAPMPYEPIVAPASFSVVSFMTNGSGFSGPGGTAIATDGSLVYGQVAEGHGDVAGTYNDTVLALDPKTLEVRDYFTPSGTLPALKKDVEAPGVTPAVFQWNGKDVLVVGGRDGRLYLLDGSSLGGSDHHTPLFATDPIVTPDAKFSGNGIWGTFSTWTDAANNNTRWLYAAVRGPVATKFPGANGAAPMGSIVAFKVEDHSGKPALTPEWVSRDMISPANPITSNGLVYALSSGQNPRVAKETGAPYTVAEQEKLAKNAVFYILDGATGQELFSSGAAVNGFSTSGLAFATGRAFFSTHDNTLYAYGIPEVR